MESVTRIDHMVFIVADLQKTERFYSVFCDNVVHRDADSIAFHVGITKLFFTLPFHERTRSEYNKDTTGLNHLAFHVATVDDLKEYETILNFSNVHHSGIIIDPYGGKEFIWCDDPDGIRLEFYVR